MGFSTSQSTSEMTGGEADLAPTHHTLNLGIWRLLSRIALSEVHTPILMGQVEHGVPNLWMIIIPMKLSSKIPSDNLSTLVFLKAQVG